MTEEDRKEIQEIALESVTYFVLNEFGQVFQEHFTKSLTEFINNELRNIIKEVIKAEVPIIVDNKITDFALKLPAVISNLVMESTAKVKMYQEFITRNNYLRTVHAELVAKIVMDVESDNPGKPYADILGLADPIIKERLKMLSGMNFEKTEKPTDLQYKGELGEL